MDRCIKPQLTRCAQLLNDSATLMQVQRSSAEVERVVMWACTAATDHLASHASAAPGPVHARLEAALKVCALSRLCTILRWQTTQLGVTRCCCVLGAQEASWDDSSPSRGC